MSDASLRDRLRRTARPVVSPLDSLEERCVGRVSDEAPLRERLQALMEAAAARVVSRPRTALQDVAPGEVVENAHGTFYRLEHRMALDAFHGHVPLTRLRLADPDSVEIVAGEPGFEGFALDRAVFLDTETTGLAGGAGTAAFLIGLGFVEDQTFVVRQYFMRDYNEEPAMLHALAADVARFRHLVTYNGKMFDMPLLDARFRLNRARFALSGDAAHLDLLHPARRLWKLRLESCRLQALESALLGVRRTGDIPGEEIPQVYFRYVRNRDPRAIGRIFEHNKTDIVSLAALAALACQWVQEGEAGLCPGDDARDVYSLGRVLERAQRVERAQSAYRKALSIGEGPLRIAALLRLASQARRSGDYESAATLWEEGARAGDCAAFRALAIHHERRRRDASAALRVVEAALLALRGERDPCCRRVVAEMGRRRVRLQARLARREAAQLSSL